MKRDFLSLLDFSAEELQELINLAAQLKKDPQAYSQKLKGKTLGMIFQKHSTRTRVSFEVGMDQLGGTAFFYGPGQLQLSRGESLEDTAKVLSRYLNGILVRTHDHQEVMTLAKYATVPVVNGLTDFNHPCQALSDLFTLKEKFGRLEGLKLCYIGVANNVAHSLLFGGLKMGMDICLLTPKEYGLNENIYQMALSLAGQKGLSLTLTDNISRGVSGSHVIYTDKWVSMGQEEEGLKRKEICQSFQVTPEIMKGALPNAVFMHCLPAQRGMEVSEAVIDGKQSIIYDQAENRLHTQKAILCQLLQ